MMEFVSWDYDIPNIYIYIYIYGKIKAMFQSTNQVNVKKKHHGTSTMIIMFGCLGNQPHFFEKAHP